MIAFGTSITKPEVYSRCARAGIERAREPDSELIAADAVGSIATSYNRLLDQARALEDLEAFVLVHQDAEIVDAAFCAKVRNALADPDVAVIGCVGAIGVRSIAWWEGSVTLSNFANRYDEHGGGDIEAFSWDWDTAPPYARVGEVETIDGFVMALSPWAVDNVRFDEDLSAFHGYDLDYCLQVREAGRKVVTADFRAIHHRRLEMIPEPQPWIEAHVAVAEKWDGRAPGVGDDVGSWRERALRAAAERDLARAIAHSNRLELRARVQQLERELAEAKASNSWRLTSPLRRMGVLR